MTPREERLHETWSKLMIQTISQAEEKGNQKMVKVFQDYFDDLQKTTSNYLPGRKNP